MSKQKISNLKIQFLRRNGDKYEILVTYTRRYEIDVRVSAFKIDSRTGTPRHKVYDGSKAIRTTERVSSVERLEVISESEAKELAKEWARHGAVAQDAYGYNWIIDNPHKMEGA